MAVNLSSIPQFLLPGLRAITGKYDNLPVEWPDIFEKTTSKMAIERSVEARYMPVAQVKTEGAPVAFDNNAGARFTYNQQHQVLSLGFAITREAIEDNLYKSQFGPTQMGLQESFRQTEDIIGATVLNTATTYNSAIGGDGQPLCSTSHPIDAGTYANRPTTDMDLNETALESANIGMRYFRDQAGLKTPGRPMRLVVPPQLKYAALRILETELRVGTANNDVNAMRKAGDFKKGLTINDYLTSNYAWFILTDKKGLVYMERAPFETDMQVDFASDNVLVKGRKRFSFGFYDPRAIYGSFPTS